MDQPADVPTQTAQALLQQLAVNVLTLRNAANWSTRALAEHCRIDRRTLQRLEHGELRTLSLDKIDGLARGLGVRTGALLGGKAEDARESDSHVRETLSGNIIRAREALGWTQEDLAARSGLSRPLVAHIERQARNPDLKTLVRLATALGLSVELLLAEPRGRP